MFVVFDLETTGFSEFTCDVVEFAYIMFDENNCYVKGEQLYFYYEGMSWSDEAYNVHHISLDFLRTQKDKFKENIIKMYTVLNHANVVGHNALRFDCPFARTWLMRMGIRNLEFGVIQDTMTAFKPIIKKSRISLSKLAAMLQITPDTVNTLMPIWFPGATDSHSHEAGYDVIITALATLQAINKRLIAFEPLISAKSDVSSDDISGLYEEASKMADPDRFIVMLLDAGEDSDNIHYKFVNHNHTEFIDETPGEVDVSNYKKMDRLFPVTLLQNGGSYKAAVDDATYTYTENTESGDIFEMQLPYGTFKDTDLDISLIIKNNFKSEVNSIV